MNQKQRVLFVDGDWTVAQPDGPPNITYPLPGDSVLSTRDVVFFGNVQNGGLYGRTPLGTAPNIQPWSANQTVAILEQSFLVDMESYEPLRLNTPYNPSWALPWLGMFSDGQPSFDLASLILVNEGEPRDAGVGVYRVNRRWAIVPGPRNEMEQFTYTFPGYADSVSGVTRQSFQRTVNSRLQYDYFVFDDWNVLNWPLFPQGRRLNADTGLYPSGLIIPEQYYYSPTLDAVDKNIFLEPGGSLSDADPSDPSSVATIPSFTDYSGFAADPAAEIVAQGSTFDRWLGNIWVRRTRFVLAM